MRLTKPNWSIGCQNPAVEVVFHGGMPPSELAPHFHAAHYLLSSTTQENFGHSIVEAWAHGCPVLISDRTPWRGLEAHNVGWDWPLDESEWHTGLNTALTLNHAEWEAKSRAARHIFRSAFKAPKQNGLTWPYSSYEPHQGTFGIQYPIIQAGMIWCSGWELASAVSNAGGLGIIGAGSMYPEVLRIKS